ncbi:hypothetical protein L1887_63122 [Cichorium endivia]|nr:hypothetical protein L1887_63122 [Cichorium endivia]
MASNASRARDACEGLADLPLVEQRDKDAVRFLALERIEGRGAVEALCESAADEVECVFVEKGDLCRGCLVCAEEPGVEPTVEAEILAEDDVQGGSNEEDLVGPFDEAAKERLVDGEVGDEDVERVAAHEEEVVVEGVGKTANHEAEVLTDEQRGVVVLREVGHPAGEIVERGEAHGRRGDERKPEVLQKVRRLHSVRDAVEQADCAVKVLARLFLETGEQGHLERPRERTQVVVERQVKGLVDGEQRRLDRRGGILKEGEEARRPYVEVSAQAVGADDAEDVVVDIERALVDARRQRRVETLRETLCDDELARHHVVRRIRLDGLVEAREERDEVGPLADAVEGCEGALYEGEVLFELGIRVERALGLERPALLCAFCGGGLPELARLDDAGGGAWAGGGRQHGAWTRLERGRRRRCDEARRERAERGAAAACPARCAMCGSICACGPIQGARHCERARYAQQRVCMAVVVVVAVVVVGSKCWSLRQRVRIADLTLFSLAPCPFGSSACGGGVLSDAVELSS